MDKETFDRIVEIIDNGSYEAESYSGRGMYGRDCLAIRCHDPLALMAELGAIVCENAEDLDEARNILEHLTEPSSDSMGRGGAIIYWKRVPWLGSAPGEEDDSEVEVDYDEYEESHSKRPHGEGTWAFYLEGKAEPLFIEGDFKETLKKAIAAAKEAGVGNLTVGP